MSASEHKSRLAVIAGLGRTGLACAKYLHARGWRIAVTDTRAEPPELAALHALDPGIPVRLGGLDASLLEGAALAVASPGLPLADPFFAQARRRGIEVAGDIELFARAAARPVAGITGTNGKSTVTTLAGCMAERAGRAARVGGNLGKSALDLLPEPGAQEPDSAVYVLELSSFQLETTQSLHLAAAAVLNVSPDHLDRYATIEDYAAAKARIFAHCGTAVVNLDDPRVAAMPRPGQAVSSFSLRADAGADFCLAPVAGEPWLTRRGEPLMPLASLKLKGLHNAANALAALALGEALGLALAPMLAELERFTGLPHRSEFVAEVAGVTYIDDSKGTNVGATVAAVAGLSGSLVMILGGDGKGQDFAPLAAALRGRTRHAVLIGRDAAAVARALEGVTTLERCETLEVAVIAAARAARRGDTVLLSPACASLDMFRDYAHRGRVFAQSVRGLAA
ncbi:MAG: UDP-N-acetylmuramoyl-L-alanine--D-glutamate ligase [Steroidobacteraceae bacterium]